MPTDDAVLVRKTLLGDRSAYGELVRRYQDRLFNTVYRLLGHTEDARDVVQDAFVSAYQSLSRFQGDSKFYTWIYRIAVNAAISLRRRQRDFISLEVERSNGRQVIDPADESANHQPGAAIERQDEELRLQRGLMCLGSDFRTVLVLCDIDGLKYEDIAKYLGIPVGTVRSRLHRARLELRTVLSPDDSGIRVDRKTGATK